MMKNGAKAGLNYRNPVTEFNCLAPLGVWEGITSINKFGENTDVALDSREDIWGGGGLYPFPATALITSISQTVDQAALRGAEVHIDGLDSNWQLVKQITLLDATLTTTVVTLATPLLRIFRMQVHASATNDSTIRAHNSAETVDYAIVGVGHMQTTMAIYTVPAGKTAFMENYFMHHHPAVNQNPTSLNIHLWARDHNNSGGETLKHTVGIDTGGSVQHNFTPYLTFTEKTDIYISATTVGKSAYVSAGFDLILIDHELFTPPG